MVRFAKRPLEWIDVDPRFEGASAQDHVRNARGFIGRLESEGGRKFKGSPEQAARWAAGCLELKQCILKLGTTESLDLHTDMREFFQAFEHERYRIYQMSYSGTGWTPNQVLTWFDLIYKHSTYAILAAHLPDRQEINTLATRIQMKIGAGGVTSTTTTTGKIKKPGVLKKYRTASKRLRN